jgi:hypothetical protein
VPHADRTINPTRIVSRRVIRGVYP